jgi:spore maturation protein CgeB
MAWYYAGTKIAINHTRTVKGKSENGKDIHIRRREAWSLGPRPYEIAACGTFMLSDNRRPELKKVFGKTVPTYKNGRDLVKKIDYYLTHADERLDLSIAALERVANCTFEDRARQILVPLIEEVI